MKKKKNIWQWIFVVYCFLSALTFGFTFGSLLALICGIAALPIQPVRDLWNEYLPDRFRWVKKAAIIALFCISMAVMPVTETEPDNNVKTEQSSGDEKEGELEDKESENIKDEEDEKDEKEETTKPSNLTQTTVDLSSVGAFSGKPYVTLNDNKPTFAEVSTKTFEQYAELDSLGRCGMAYACVGKDIMPTEERGAIGQVKPTGWHTIKYDIVDGKYLYNRCHLIGYQLTGENANEKNLITGTRYMNMDGMLPFENMIADYVQETGNHVMYRVTPHFIGNNLLASGVQMEAYSVEDNGAGVCFNVYAYNAQPGITINYANGDSSLGDTTQGSTTQSNATSNNASTSEETSNITSSNEGNTNATNDNGPSSDDNTSPDSGSVMVWIPQSGEKYHRRAGCSNMKNPTEVTKEEAESRDYKPCKKCY